MDRRRYYEPTSSKSWLGFAIFVAALCLFKPYVLGIVIGIGLTLAMMYGFYKVMGG